MPRYNNNLQSFLGHQCQIAAEFFGNAVDFTFKSYLWSIKKKKWLPGPDVGDFSYENACGVSLNSSSVLMIGAAQGHFIEMQENTKTLIYNFELQKLSEQQSLPRVYKGSEFEWIWPNKMACTVLHGKNSTRYN